MPTVLQNVVFPQERDPDVLPLYVDGISEDGDQAADKRWEPVVDVLDRHTARIPDGSRISFGTYFNAFPASYWQRWTEVRSVELVVRLSGEGTIVVYRSDAAGVAQQIDVRPVANAEARFSLDLSTFPDGGWLWFDVAAHAAGASLDQAQWVTESEPVRGGKASIGITTHNKPDYCAATLASLAASPALRESIDTIFVIDQGDRHVEDEPGFETTSAALGDTLQVIRQPNLGGSGGFSRAMAETLERPDSAFVQLLDDDVVIEPEAMRRGIVFAYYTSIPTIVGGHMLDLLHRPSLHALAEVIDDDTFAWHPVDDDQMPHDLRRSNLRQSPLLHRRHDADFNGWWMCLIPTSTIREVGLAIPAFIKWDDAEFCLRAREAGTPTVSLPGVALWHISWSGKDDFLDWQAYFHARNRIVAALLHSPAPRGGSLLKHSRRMDLKHLIAMQYYPVALRHRALRDVLSGPGHMMATLPTRLTYSRRLARGYRETEVISSADPAFASLRGPQTYDEAVDDAPRGWRLAALTASSLFRLWWRSPRPERLAQPEVEIANADFLWWRLPDLDSALVPTADGSAKTVYVRDRARFRSQLADSIRLHRALRRRWNALSAEYRAASAELTSLEAWLAVFAAGEDSRTEPRRT